MLQNNNNYDEMDQGIDRITQILQRQSTPPASSPYMPQASVLPANILNAIAAASYDYGNGKGGDFTGNVQKYQNDQQDRELNQQKALLQAYDMKLKMGDAKTKALDDKITLFTGDDEDGKALFLQALHDDPESIDPTNSYQVMTKLAGIKKRTGYESPDLQLSKMKELADIRFKQSEAEKNNVNANSNLINFGPNSSAGISITNNNPGNMRPVGSSTGFQQFSTPQEGIDAMRNDLLAKINGKSNAMAGKQPTLSNLITTWAPPVENNTSIYIANVSKQTGIAPDQLLTPADVDKLIPAIIRQEGGNTASGYFNKMQPQNETSAVNTEQPNKPRPIFKGNLPYTDGLKEGSQWAMDANGKYVAVKIPEYTNEGNKINSPADQMSQSINDLASAYQELHTMGGDISTENKYMNNKLNQLKLSEGISAFGIPIIPGGQTLMKGTKQQAVIDRIGAGITGLLLDIKSASGAGAKQFDSDKDVQFMIRQASNPTNAYEANLKILDTLSRKYTGKPLTLSNDATKRDSVQASSGWSVRQVK